MSRSILMLVFACLTVLAVSSARHPKWVLASHLYPHLGPSDSSAIPARGWPLPLYVYCDHDLYGEPKEKYYPGNILLFTSGWLAVGYSVHRRFRAKVDSKSEK